MFHPKSTFALLTLLILISLLFIVLPVTPASAQGFSLEQVDKARIDAYIRTRMEVASIPGLALGVIKGDQVVYLQGYGIADPEGRAVTPQTPFNTNPLDCRLLPFHQALAKAWRASATGHPSFLALVPAAGNRCFSSGFCLDHPPVQGRCTHGSNCPSRS